MNTKIHKEWNNLPTWIRRELQGDLTSGWYFIENLGYSWVAKRRDYLSIIKENNPYSNFIPSEPIAYISTYRTILNRLGITSYDAIFKDNLYQVTFNLLSDKGAEDMIGTGATPIEACINLGIKIFETYESRAKPSIIDLFRGYPDSKKYQSHVKYRMEDYIVPRIIFAHRVDASEFSSWAHYFSTESVLQPESGLIGRYDFMEGEVDVYTETPSEDEDFTTIPDLNCNNAYTYTYTNAQLIKHTFDTFVNKSIDDLYTNLPKTP